MLALHPITTPTEIESHAQHHVRMATPTTILPSTQLITGLTQLTQRHEKMLKQQMKEMDMEKVWDGMRWDGMSSEVKRCMSHHITETSLKYH